MAFLRQAQNSEAIKILLMVLRVHQIFHPGK